MCYSFNELKANMLAQSCRCEGYATLNMNLFLTDKRTHILANKPYALTQEPQWLQDYIQGTEMKIHGFIFRLEDHGKRFTEVALFVYRETGNVLFGCQAAAGDEEGIVLVFPGEYRIKAGDVAFCISDCKEKVSFHAKLVDETIADPDVKFAKGNIADYRSQFAANQTEQSMNTTKRLVIAQACQDNQDLDAKPKEHALLSGQTKKGSGKGNGKGKGAFAVGGRGLRNLPFAPKRKVKAAPKVHLGAGEAEKKEGTEHPEEAHQEGEESPEERQRSEKEEAQEIARAGGHVVLVVSAPEQTWQQVCSLC